MARRIQMKRQTASGAVECSGLFAIERAGFKFYFVEDEHFLYLIEKTRGRSVGCGVCKYKHGGKKKLLSYLQEKSDEQLINTISKYEKIN